MVNLNKQLKMENQQKQQQLVLASIANLFTEFEQKKAIKGQNIHIRALSLHLSQTNSLYKMLQRKNYSQNSLFSNSDYEICLENHLYFELDILRYRPIYDIEFDEIASQCYQATSIKALALIKKEHEKVEEEVQNYHELLCLQIFFLWKFLLICKPEFEELILFCVKEDVSHIETWLGKIQLVNQKYVILLNEFILKKKKNHRRLQNGGENTYQDGLGKVESLKHDILNQYKEFVSQQRERAQRMLAGYQKALQLFDLLRELLKSFKNSGLRSVLSQQMQQIETYRSRLKQHCSGIITSYQKISKHQRILSKKKVP